MEVHLTPAQKAFVRQAIESGRLHPVALIPMHSALLAQRELDRVAAKGFTSVVIRPAFHVGPRLTDHSPEGQMREAMRRILSAASAGVETPAMGAWRIGRRTPSLSRSVSSTLMGHSL